MASSTTANTAVPFEVYQTTVIHQRTPHSSAVLAQEPGECFLLVQHAARAKPVSDVRQIPAQNLVVALSLKPAMHGFLILRVGNRLAARASFRNVSSGNYADYARIPNRSAESSNIYSSGPLDSLGHRTCRSDRSRRRIQSPGAVWPAAEPPIWRTPPTMKASSR